MPPAPPTLGSDESRHASDGFDDWYETHFDYVWRSIKRLGVPSSDVVDVTHDVFVVAWRQRHQLDPERPLRPWLFGVCFRLASAFRRRAWFRSLRHGVEMDSADWRPGPEQTALLKADFESLTRAIARVPLKQRAVVLLHDFDETPAAEVAAALGIPLKTVYSRLDAGRKRFRIFYRQQELTRTATANADAVSPGEW
jgi:RNA polymerase sigma-70 factor, ECF subfamily